MHILKFPVDGLAVKSSAIKVTQTCLKKLERFFCDPSASQILRRDSLVLQLTSRVENFMSTFPKEGEAPKVVDLLRGKAHDEVDITLSYLLENLIKDPRLDQAAAATALLATAGDLMARLNMYREYPYVRQVVSSDLAARNHFISAATRRNARHGIFVGIAEYGFGPR